MVCARYHTARWRTLVVLLVTVALGLAFAWRQGPIREKLDAIRERLSAVSLGHGLTNHALQTSGPILEVPPAIVFRGSNVPKSQAERDLVQRPTDPKVLNDAGTHLWSSGQKDRGTELLSRAHASLPDDPVINYNYSRMLYDAGNTGDAIHLLEEATRRKPAFDEARLLLASAAVQRGDYNLADQHLQQVTSKVQVVALTIQGTIQLFTDKPKDALASFEQALTLARGNAAALYNVGLGFQQNGDLSQASTYYQQAINVNPKLAAAYNNLGTILMQQGDGEAAFDRFHQAALLDPSSNSFAAHLTTSSHGLNDTADKIVGRWTIEEGTLQISGMVRGSPVSRSMAMPTGSQIDVTKTGVNQYRLDETVAGVHVSAIFQLQPDSSYQAPAVVPPELATLLPPGVSDTGTVTFWARGDTLFGDTRETVSGPNTSFRTLKTWKARRIRTGLSE